MNRRKRKKNLYAAKEYKTISLCSNQGTQWP